MRRFRFIFGVALLLVAASHVFATSNSANAAHLQVQLVFPHEQLYPGGTNAAGLYFKLEPGWHVYWQNAGDSGEPPKIQWTLPSGVTAGALQFPAPRRLPLGPLMDFGYENEVLFPFSFQVADSLKQGPAVLHAKINWLVCREVCIPGKAQLDENVQLLRGAPMAGPVSAVDQALWDRLANSVPPALPSSDTAVFQPTQTGFRLAVSTGQRETQAVFFPEDENIIDNPAPQPVAPLKTGLVLDLKKDANLTASPTQLRGVLELSGGRNYEIAATREVSFGVAGMEYMPAAAPTFSFVALARIAGLAFLGGILLNLMPCVFPVLFLKGLALCRSGTEERSKLCAHGLVYAAGILVSFWVLVAALLGLRAAGATLGWGFQFQSPVFLSLMAALLFFLGLSLAGQFEIGLTLTSAGGSLAAKQGYAGSFFTGVLAVVVATPCTAPFMGAAIGYALAQSAAVTFVVFTALALGLAAPYVVLTLQPAWTSLLPKPGAWMDVLKQAVSVPIFATVIWLAWVVAQAYGAALLAALLVSFLLLAIAGWFLGRWPAKRWAMTVAALIVLGVIGFSVVTSEQFAVSVPNLNSDDMRTLAPMARTRLAEMETWHPWSADAVQRSLAAGQPVFVDFTASWCLSCQVNERVALSRPEMMQAFGAANVVLFRADWTRQDPAITQALTELGRSGVPVYALYTPGQAEPQLLPQVLTPGIVMDALGKLPKSSSQTK
ncbi:MAG: thioredoxin family protein [Terracidiphilus sp.]|jgi:thiol:disulfide interchange protein DsbD